MWKSCLRARAFFNVILERKSVTDNPLENVSRLLQAPPKTVTRFPENGYSSSPTGHASLPLRHLAATSTTIYIGTLGFAVHEKRQQERSIHVEVKNGDVERALKRYKWKYREESSPRMLRARQVYMKPSEKKLMLKKEGEIRRRTRAFKDKVDWIMSKRSRYVPLPGWRGWRHTHAFNPFAVGIRCQRRTGPQYSQFQCVQVSNWVQNLVVCTCPPTTKHIRLYCIPLAMTAILK